jgi:hypothetical protein
MREILEIHAYILAFIVYFIFEYFIRKLAYPIEPKPSLSFLPKWAKGKEWTIFISPGYWLARYYKKRIMSFPENRNKHLLRLFIRRNNMLNLISSAIITVTSFHLLKVDSDETFFFFILSAFVLFRLISRSFEIAFAFSKDVMSVKKSRSGLRKQRRIQLAIRSYIELFIISAPVYYAYGVAGSKIKAITLSLSIGSLTNIGAAFPKDYNYFANLVFIQVFAALLFMCREKNDLTS